MSDDSDQLKAKWRPQTRAIAAGIIASLIVFYFLNPILSFLGRLTLKVAAIGFHSYADRIYAEIATGEPNFGFMFLSFVSGIVLGAWAYLLGVFVGGFRRQGERRPPGRRYRIVVPLLLLVVTLVAFAGLVDSYIRLKSVSSFQQRLAVLTPHLSDQQRKEFVARFASMRRRVDFESIMRDLDAIASQKKVSLPENKLYPF